MFWRNTQNFITNCVQITPSYEQLLVFYQLKVCAHSRVQVLCLLLSQKCNITEKIQPWTYFKRMHDPAPDHIRSPGLSVSYM